MDNAQLATLLAAVNADQDPAIIAAHAARNDTELARLLNLPKTPTFYIWRSLVPQDEIMLNGFSWTEVDNLTVGKARIWEWLFDNERRAINATKPNVIAGIVECWSGTAGKLAVRAAVLGHCQRAATVAERYFSTGAGTAADASGVGPGVASFEGTVTINDIGSMHNL